MKNLKYKSLDEILRTHLLKQREISKTKHDNDWWYASELGTCLRKQFLRRSGLNPVQKEFRISFLAEQGKAIHKWVQYAVKDMKVAIAIEESLVDEKLRYKGRLDLIIDLGNKTHPHLSLVDIKTQRPEAFFRRAKLPVGKRVLAFQKKQLASYFYFAKKQGWPDLKDARIYYIDRGGGVREEYIFNFKQKMFDEILDELNTLNKYWKEQKLPPCSNTFVCRDYCKPFKKELKKVEDGQLTLKEFLKNHARKTKKK